ncbi:glycoside hydrolase family 30 protein [Dyella sp.]|jgi:glucosylceramidase|uniref:glycoside hydrolase family 30 protein n=1 Tax=Dyella sp. TaxID=1869338 RepID=UPI002D783539|nr:glycoside hydrolase family 30 beta sandwich domain-containing protein [Dyella sp.]HET6432912.1 glycoside hydrolase family 30 beta sandwich domain-containing protein [Dyella sp.]
MVEHHVAEPHPARHRHLRGWLAIALFALIASFTLASLFASRIEPPPAPQARPQVKAPAPVLPSVRLWLSTADRRLRLARQPDVPLQPRDALPKAVIIDRQATYQSIVGFGAAITDASAWLLRHRLDAAQRSALLQELFGPPPGLNMSMTRLTIGASDFSLQPYTLDDMPAGETDEPLAHFNLGAAGEDLLPTVREALAINPQLRIIASPWSAPAWMKSTGNLIRGELLEAFEGAFAEYLVRYVETLRSEGVPVFALTVQNEPAFEPATYPGMSVPAATRARLIGQYLGPALARRAPGTQILEWDHNWDAPGQPREVLADAAAARYVDGIAWHCYAGTPSVQSDVHREHPDKDVYITECSGGDWASAKKGELLWFARDLLLAGVRNWARGVVYWNLALDEQHGPHSGGCGLCKGVVTIDSRTGEVSRNDEYYAFGHFSRFVLPGAVRVGSGETDKDLNNVAFRNPGDESLVLVVVNSHAQERPISVVEGGTGFRYMMPAQSVATFVWNPDPVGTWLRRALRWWNGGQAPGDAG